MNLYRMTKLLAIALGTLCSSIIPTHAQISMGDDFAPFGWLQVPIKKVVVDIRQEGLKTKSRPEAAYLVTEILDLVTQAGYTAYLPHSFIDSEIAYLKREQSERDDPQIKALLQFLQESLKTNTIDWKSLADIRVPDGSGRLQPWSKSNSKYFKSSRILVQSKQGEKLPTLEIILKWEERDGYQVGGQVVGTSLSVNNFSASLNFVDANQKTAFQKEYAAGEYPTSFSGFENSPAGKQIQRIRKDIKRGINVAKFTPLTPSRKDAALLSGSSWKIIQESLYEELDCIFDESGTFKVWFGKREKGGKWEQDGDVVRFSYFSPGNGGRELVECEARISDGGDKMSGTSRSEDKGSWTFTATPVRK